jgi:replication-associated recombination protein RarA
MEHIIGHTHIVSLFDRLLRSGQLSHAYCLVGPAHIGKHTMAREIAAQYLGVSVAQLELHPDITQLAPEDKENGKIKIEMVRTCKEFLSQTSVHGRGLVVIIDDAHTLTDEAANALLKSIEEPPKKTLFLLVTPFDSLLPETIRSRCQTVQCAPMSFSEIVSALTTRGVSSTDAHTYATIADGRIGIALVCAESVEAYMQINECYMQSERLHRVPLYEKIQLLHDVVEDETLSLSQRTAHWCVSDMQRVRTAVISTGVCDEQVLRRVCQYGAMLSTLKTNTNKQLTLEQFVF